MKVVVFPFYSAQDKRTGEFLLRKCCTTNISVFLAARFIELGCEVHVSLPQGFGGKAYGDALTMFPRGTKLRSDVMVPSDNLLQRLHFDASGYRTLVHDADLVVSHNEINSARLKAVMKPTARLIQFNHLMPRGVNEWMKDSQVTSWRAADAVVFLSDGLREFAYHQTARTIPPFLVWPMVYSEDEAVANLYKWGDGDSAVPWPTHDFLFPHRASSNGYTNHLVFMDALEKLNTKVTAQANCLFLDPTGYLKHSEKARLEENRDFYRLAMAEDRRSYWHALSSCRVVVGTMADDLHGGVSVREAVRAGCFPVLYKNKAYVDFARSIACEFLTEYMFNEPTAESICEAMLKAYLNKPWDSTVYMSSLAQGIGQESFESAWQEAAMVDLARLVDVVPGGWGKAIL